MIELSVVICSYNRAPYIPAVLESLGKQTLAVEKYEIILVDNNSKDNTKELADQFEAANPHLNYRYVLETEAGLSCARNRGIREAVGRYVSFIDDDGIAEPEYAEEMVRAFEQNPNFESLGGKVLPIFPQGKDPVWMSKYIQGIVSKVDYGEQQSQFFEGKYPVGCNMGFRREVFDTIGLFNTDLEKRSDDKYIFNQIRRHSMRILYAPKVVVHHNMEQYRIEKPYIVQLSREIGHAEKLRLKEEGSGLMSTFFQYLFKFGASLILGLGFLLQGKMAKAYYIVLVRYYVLIGFLFGEIKS